MGRIVAGLWCSTNPSAATLIDTFQEAGLDLDLPTLGYLIFWLATLFIIVGTLFIQ